MKDYQHIDDLPQALRKELPELAQQTYLAAYQRTWEKCAMAGEKGETGLATRAHEAAMLAVQSKFEKDERGRWRHAPVGQEIDMNKLEGPVEDGD